MSNLEILQSYIPKYLWEIINFPEGTIITNEEYNQRWNLNVTQGDYHAMVMEALIKLLTIDGIGALKVDAVALATRLSTLDTGLASLVTLTGARDAANVKKTGDQTVDGIKTFVRSPVIPLATQAGHPVTKATMDANNTQNATEHTTLTNNLNTANGNITAVTQDVSNHKAATNPHLVTAAQVGAYSKVEVQTSGQAAIHWGNLTNVPNMADASWKGAVATPAALPTTGNALGQQRVVLNDGDGKSAVYICVAITGTADAQWDKIGDVDWASEEATRVTQESARVAAENLRVSIESARVAAEAVRSSSESNRVIAEDSRVTVEGARVIAETARDVNESARVASENIRLANETDRGIAESGRANAEEQRAIDDAYRDAKLDQLEHRGTFVLGTAYLKNNSVLHNGSTYIAIQNNTDIVVTDPAYWTLAASKGADGIGSGDMLKAEYDTGNTGVVDNSERLDGQLPTHYAKTIVSSRPVTPAAGDAWIEVNVWQL